MRRFFAFTCCCSCCAAVLGGCRKSEKRAADTAAIIAAPAAAAPGTAAALTPRDVAGKWNMRTTNEAGDSTLVVYVLNATPNLTGSTLTFKGRPPVPVRIVLVGDSVVTDAGPYESMLRKGVQVTTHGVSRMQGGKLVGTTTAHYKTSGPDSVRRLRTEGTKAQ